MTAHYALDLNGLSAGAVGDVVAARLKTIHRGDLLEVACSCPAAVTELSKRAHWGELRLVRSEGTAPNLRFLLQKP